MIRNNQYIIAMDKQFPIKQDSKRQHENNMGHLILNRVQHFCSGCTNLWFTSCWRCMKNLDLYNMVFCIKGKFAVRIIELRGGDENQMSAFRIWPEISAPILFSNISWRLVENYSCKINSNMLTKIIFNIEKL